jgi:hypothetical protein
MDVIALPSEKYRLEEINLSGQLVESLAGKTVPIEIVSRCRTALTRATESCTVDAGDPWRP